ncbi:MAG TPA: hypothetical protein VFQ22_13125, partial [Longimicrobiales bacterium]|nr:hypothetical protein [Longimicrobiales bacterium]
MKRTLRRAFALPLLAAALLGSAAAASAQATWTEEDTRATLGSLHTLTLAPDLDHLGTGEREAVDRLL